MPTFTKAARDLLIALGTLNWSEINPDIFGSMFQAVVNPDERSDLGQHYTSVPNILKTIEPLFLDGLRERVRRRLRLRSQARGAAGADQRDQGVRPRVRVRQLPRHRLQGAAQARARDPRAPRRARPEAPGAVRRVEDQHRELLRHRARRLRHGGRDPVALDRQAPDEHRVQGEVQPLHPADPAQGDRPDPAGQRDARRLERGLPERRRRDLPDREPAVHGREDADRRSRRRTSPSSSASARTRRTSTTSRCGSSRARTTSRARERSSRSSPRTRSPKASTSG